jgi:hypothetical protein
MRLRVYKTFQEVECHGARWILLYWVQQREELQVAVRHVELLDEGDLGGWNNK